MDDKTRLEGLKIEKGYAERSNDDERLSAVKSEISDLEEKIKQDEESSDHSGREDSSHDTVYHFEPPWETAPVDKNRLEESDGSDNVLAKKTGELEAASMEADEKIAHEAGDLPALNDAATAAEVDEGGRASTVDESRDTEGEPSAAPAEEVSVSDEDETEDEATSVPAPVKRGRPKKQ